MEYILKTENLHVSYGGIIALRGVNISVPKGQIIAILGANGAGKTTLLKTISNSVQSNEGKVIFLGEDITKRPMEKIVMDGISHVPEGRRIFGDLTVYENLKIGAFTLKNKDILWDEIYEETKSPRLLKLYETVKQDNSNPELVLNKKEAFIQNLNYIYDLFPVLKERKQQTASTLSGGEMQMLAIARALMGSPKLLILDEPSLGLAPLIIRDIFEIIEKLKSAGISILIVEQNALQTLKIADYAYILQVGRVVREDKASVLIRDKDLIEAYLG
jgi:branched-chain amino acid transport system ATP-binding protein